MGHYGRNFLRHKMFLWLSPHVNCILQGFTKIIIKKSSLFYILVHPALHLSHKIRRYFRLLVFKASALWADTFYKSICPSVCLSVCPCVCVFVRVFTFEVPFNGLLAPTSRSRMSNIFRDLESLGKSNGKNWSNIWTFLLGSGLKSPHKKKVFFWLILPYKTWWKPRFPMD